jgi:hypothetical protein
VEVVEQAEDDNGWTVLTTTINSEVCTGTEVLQACHNQFRMEEPGARWIKNPAAITSIWLEKPERIAA